MRLGDSNIRDYVENLRNGGPVLATEICGMHGFFVTQQSLLIFFFFLSSFRVACFLSPINQKLPETHQMFVERVKTVSGAWKSNNIGLVYFYSNKGMGI